MLADDPEYVNTRSPGTPVDNATGKAVADAAANGVGKGGMLSDEHEYVNQPQPRAGDLGAADDMYVNTAVANSALGGGKDTQMVCLLSHG